jgi:ABC-2 type transport system ATP-binding protein
MQHRLFEELNYHNKEGATVFISTHNLPEVEAFCTRTAFIREGKIISVEDMASGYQPGKVVTLTGSAIVTEDFESKGYRVLSKTDRVVSLLYKDNVKQILADMAPLDLEDIEIRNQNLEEKFMTLYGGGGSHE